MSRLAKQLLIGGVYLLIFGLLGWWVFRVFVPAPVCTDGIQNGGEEGVDCGAVCGKSCPVAVKPLENLPVHIIKTGPTSYDILAHLENPNGGYGASRIDYTLTVTDGAGQQLATRTGVTYVNPAQPRWLLFPLQNLATQPASAQLQFNPGQVQWAGLQIDTAGNVEFAVRSDQLTPTAGGVHYQATVTNRSTFDFDTVDITVLLYDSANRIVGVGTTIVRTHVAGETRAFVVDWPFPVPDAVRAQAIVTTNIFANSNFIRTYGSQEQFQGF